MNVPQDLKYTKEHEWVKIEGDIAIIGITDFAQGELGELVYVEVDTVGETIKRDEIFLSLIHIFSIYCGRGNIEKI